MSINCRFALDEERKVIHAVNLANAGKAYCHRDAQAREPRSSSRQSTTAYQSLNG